MTSIITDTAFYMNTSEMGMWSGMKYSPEQSDQSILVPWVVNPGVSCPHTHQGAGQGGATGTCCHVNINHPHMATVTLGSKVRAQGQGSPVTDWPQTGCWTWWLQSHWSLQADCLTINCYWPCVWGIHQLLVDSPHKGPITHKYNGPNAIIMHEHFLSILINSNSHLH